MRFLLEHLTRQSKTSLLIQGYVSVLLITLADYVTGPDQSLFVFYFVPIIIISWYVGRTYGLHMALAAGIASSIHDVLYMHSFALWSTGELLTYWGVAQRSIAFLIVSITVAALRSSEEKKRRLEYEIARQVQSFLLPAAAPSLPHFSCHGSTRPSDHLSGDLHDFVLLDSGKLGIVVGDVCGKGMSAALLMAYIQGVLRSQAHLHGQALGVLMRSVNRALYTSTASDKFATLFIGVYDDLTRTLTYVNAGHQPPMVIRRGRPAAEPPPADVQLSTPPTPSSYVGNGRSEIVTLEPGGLILGVDPSAEYAPQVVAMSHGDILVCVTDGVEEARDRLGEQYTSKRLARVVSAHNERSPEELCGLVMKDIDGFVGIEPQFDDMTLVIGKVV
jgi:phosphoserine phosphatase RsbU/P